MMCIACAIVGNFPLSTLSHATREKCQRNFTIMQCSPDPAGGEHIVFFVGVEEDFPGNGELNEAL